MDFTTALVTVLTQAWPVVAIALGILFARDIKKILPNIRKAGPVELADGAAQQAAPSALHAPTLSEFKELEDPNPNALVVEVETDVKRALEQIDAAKRTAYLVRAVSILRISVAFENFYSAIYGSQLAVMRRAVGSTLTLSEIEHFYQTASSMEPDFYANFSFEKWFRFLEAAIFLTGDRTDGYTITLRGQEFLKYLVDTGKSDWRPH